jgi:hypothetical protein
MLTTPTHHNRRRRAGAVLATFGLGLPVGMAPALAETLTAQAQVEVEASVITDAGTADSDDDTGLVGAVTVGADVSVDGHLDRLLDGSGGGHGDTDLPGIGLPGASGLELPNPGLPNLGLPGLGLPSLGLPSLGLPGLGLPGLGLPGLGVLSLPDRLPSLVLPAVITAPSAQDDDPAVVNAGHVGPVGGRVTSTEGESARGSAPVPGTQPTHGPAQSAGAFPGSLPRTGADLRVRAFAAIGLLGLAGLTGRRRRSV